MMDDTWRSIVSPSLQERDEVLRKILEELNKLLNCLKTTTTTTTTTDIRSNDANINNVQNSKGEYSTGSVNSTDISVVYPIISNAVRLRYNCPYDDVRSVMTAFFQQYMDIPHISHVVERLVPSFYIPVDSILSFSKLDETSVAIMQRHFLRNGRMGSMGGSIESLIPLIVSSWSEYGIHLSTPSNKQGNVATVMAMSESKNEEKRMLSKSLISLFAKMAHKPWGISVDDIRECVQSTNMSVAELLLVATVAASFHALACIYWSIGVTPEYDMWSLEQFKEENKAVALPYVNIAPLVPILSEGVLTEPEDSMSIMNKDKAMLTLQEVSWEELGFPLMDKYLPSVAAALDVEFKTAMSCESFGSDEENEHKAVWMYAQREHAVVDDEYDYKSINKLPSCQTLKTFLRKLVRNPSSLSENDFKTMTTLPSYDLRKVVRYAVISAEAKKQASLLHIIKTVAAYLNQ